MTGSPSRLAFSILLATTLVSTTVSSAEQAEAVDVEANAAPASSEESGKFADGPDWLIVVSPTGGFLHNTTKFKFRVPSGRDASGEYIYKVNQAKVTDSGWGGGVTLMGFYRWMSLASIFFGFPDVNQSKLLGNISYLSLNIPTPILIEPYLGLGLALINTDTDYNDFRYSHRSSFATFDESGESQELDVIGYADFPSMQIDNQIVAPYPKLGLKFKIPIQHWHVTPFYSFMYEYVKTRARSDGGHVEIYEAEGPSSRAAGAAPMLDIDVGQFDKTLVKEYKSHLVGADWVIDFHYFLQLRGKLYYNTTHDLWTVRLIGSMILTGNLGLTAYFEYTQKITVTNTYFLIGPAFVFTPPGFMEEMMARRKKKKG